jgi:competence protein ComEC
MLCAIVTARMKWHCGESRRHKTMTIGGYIPDDRATTSTLMNLNPFRCLRAMALIAGIAVPFAAVTPALQPAGTLDIYWIDVEGGASTLIVTPQGQSLLMDAGWAGFNDRDASRIEHVIKKEAGLTRLDYVLVSHFHADHAGGLAALASRLDIGAFVDHGDIVETTAAAQALWNQYLAVSGTRRRSAKPGDRLALNGVELVIVAAHSQFLTTPLAGAAPNSLCAQFQPQAEDRTENGKSLGFHLRVGQFEFLNLGDLSWNYQQQLACPVNMLGKVDLFQVTHHGTRDDVLPMLMWAIQPSVAVMNNGPAKGAGPVAVETVLRSPGLEDLWALHRAVNNDSAHNATEALTANLGETNGCEGAWIRARLDADGSTYTLTNSRNGHSKTYRVKR